MLSDISAAAKIDSRNTHIQRSFREQVRALPALSVVATLSSDESRLPVTAELRFHLACVQYPNLNRPLSKEEFIEVVVDAASAVRHDTAAETSTPSSPAFKSGEDGSPVPTRPATAQLMERLKDPSLTNAEVRSMMVADKKRRHALKVARKLFGTASSRSSYNHLGEPVPEGNQGVPIESLRSTAGNIFDHISGVGRRRSSSNTVTVREAISHFRFGFSSAAGDSRPISPVTIFSSQTASNADRRTALAYDDLPPSPLGRPASRRHLLEPLAATSSISAGSWLGRAPGSGGSRTPSPELGDWSDEDLLARHSSYSLARHSSQSALGHSRHTVSAPGGIQAKRSRRHLPPEAVLRQLNARLGKMRRKVGEAMESIHDGRGGCDLDALVDALYGLGTEQVQLKLSITKGELRAVAEMYVVEKPPLSEDWRPNTVGMRNFLRDLWSGTPTHAVKVRPASSAGMSGDQLDAQRTEDGETEEAGAATSDAAASVSFRVDEPAAGESDTMTKEEEKSKWGGTKGKLMLMRRKSVVAPPREVEWWRSIRSNSSEAQRAAAMLVEAVKEGLDEEGNITRAKFNAVLWGLGLLRSFQDEIDVIFDTLDVDHDGIVTMQELETALAGVVDEDIDTKLERLMARDDAILGATIQRLRDRLAAQASRVLDLFRKWDVDGDGIVTRAEFAKALPDLGFHDCLPSDIDALFNTFDKDGEGEISFRELHKMLRMAKPTKAKKKVVVQLVQPHDLKELRRSMRNELLEMGLRYELYNHDFSTGSSPSQSPKPQRAGPGAGRGNEGFEEATEEQEEAGTSQPMKRNSVHGFESEAEEDLMQLDGLGIGGKTRQASVDRLHALSEQAQSLDASVAY